MNLKNKRIFGSFKRKEIGNSLIFIFLGVVFLFLSRGMEADVYIIGPGFFPRLISVSLIIINVVRLFATILNPNFYTSGIITSYRPFYILTVVLISYLAGIYIIGITFSTIIFIYVVMSILGNRSLFQKALIALVVTFSIKAIFKWILVLPLPSGFWHIL